MMKGQKDTFNFRNFFDFSEVFRYFFRRKRADRKPDFNLKVMHGINKLSIILFLIAIIILIIRNLVLK